MNKDLTIKVIGVGGTGSLLVDSLARYVEFLNDYDLKLFVLIDGDVVEEKNLKRQTYSTILEYKSKQKVEQLQQLFKETIFKYINQYVDESNISDIILDGDIIFSCVDNHETRRIIDDHCQQLDNIVLLSSGNEEVDGSCQIYIRKGGVNITNPVSRFHPEIRNAIINELVDSNSCERVVEEKPQLLFTNLMAATIMCLMFRKYQEGTLDSEEVYFDINKLKVQPMKRKVGG